jgi:hypothetical protein
VGATTGGGSGAFPWSRWFAWACAVAVLLVGCLGSSPENLTGDASLKGYDATGADAGGPDDGFGGSDADATVPTDVDASDAAEAADATDGTADATSCGDAALACASGCVANDVYNCGACGVDCTLLPQVDALKTTCSAGACAIVCKPGAAHCSTDPSVGCEVDITAPARCGGCGATPCGTSTPICSPSGATYQCVASCSASAPTLCGASTCANLSSDANHCGDCATVCAGGMTCQAGHCACPASTTACGPTCYATQSDPAHCGASCTACPTPPNGVPACSGGACAVACPTAPFVTACSGACVNTTNDIANCGGCIHGCQGGMCAGSTCQPVTLGAFSAVPGDIAMDTSFVYGAIPGGSNAGLVERCALSGCPSGAGVLASNQPQYMLSIAATSTGVYWTGLEGAGGSAAGCTPASCANGVVTYETSTAEQPYTIAADGTNVYYALLNNGGTFQGVQSCPIGGCSGGTPFNFYTGGTPYYMAAAAGFVYWTDALDPSSIKKCPSGGCSGNPATLATSPASDIYRYAVADSANVYWVDATSSVAYECPITGCPAGGPIVLGPSSAPLAVDATGVYWVTASSIVRCAIGGCGSTPTTAVPNITPNGSAPFVLVSPTSFYWLSGSTLMKVAR